MKLQVFASYKVFVFEGPFLIQTLFYQTKTIFQINLEHFRKVNKQNLEWFAIEKLQTVLNFLLN